MVQIGRALGSGRSKTSFTEHVNELRLKRVYVAESRARRSCTHFLALQAGFSDISHFNWVFRARFGDTPAACAHEDSHPGGSDTVTAI
jgi:transcriptional regulator GlxA family with amidase domain